MEIKDMFDDVEDGLVQVKSGSHIMRHLEAEACAIRVQETQRRLMEVQTTADWVLEQLKNGGADFR